MRYDDPVFLLDNEQSLYNYWRFYQRCNGIDPPISLYELRHTFVSMVEDTVSPAQLRRRLVTAEVWILMAGTATPSKAALMLQRWRYLPRWQSIPQSKNNPLSNPLLGAELCALLLQ